MHSRFHPLQRLWSVVEDTARKYWKHVCMDSCSFFDGYYEDLVHDFKFEHRIGDPQLPDIVWNMLVEAPVLHKKGSQFTLVRWFSFVGTVHSTISSGTRARRSTF